VKLLLGAVLAVLVAPVLTQGCGAKSCSQTTDCDNGQACLFEMGSCSAQGQCKTFPDNGGSGCSSASGCGALQELCGCNDDIVTTGCGYPQGWASGPSTSGLACFGGGDSGAPDARVDASDASSTCTPPADATTAQDAGGCRPAPLVGADGGDACGPGQYGLRCDGVTGVPPASLGCQLAPSWVIQLIYCCPCAATGEP
jgi:hypothetical protein